MPSRGIEAIVKQDYCLGREFDHCILVCTDGNPNVIAFGNNGSGQCAVPTLPPGTLYVAAATGAYHSVLLRDDGEAVAFGRNAHGECTVPERPVGTRYIAAAAGDSLTVLLRDDGEAVILDAQHPGGGRLAHPAVGAHFVDVAAGGCHVVLLQDDGRVVSNSVDEDEYEETMAEPFPLGERYVAVAANNNETIAIRSDGVAVAVVQDDDDDEDDLPTLCGIPIENLEPIGSTWKRSFKLPDPADGGSWIKVAASIGAHHVILISSNGNATALGRVLGGGSTIFQSLTVCATSRQLWVKDFLCLFAVTVPLWHVGAMSWDSSPFQMERGV